jgi:predicted nucleic acid-binding protein
VSTSRFVLDASAALAVLAGKNLDPTLRRRVLSGHPAAPEIFDLEVLNTLRKQLRAGILAPALADRLAKRLRVFPIDRSPHRALTHRAWELRHAITPYDASYVALAEKLRLPLVTTDAKLARSNGYKAEIELYPAS